MRKGDRDGLLAIAAAIERLADVIEKRRPARSPVMEPVRRQCEYCHEWFDAGFGSDRRLDAKFCSNAHRIKHNSLKRSLFDR